MVSTSALASRGSNIGIHSLPVIRCNAASFPGLAPHIVPTLESFVVDITRYGLITNNIDNAKSESHERQGDNDEWTDDQQNGARRIFQVGQVCTTPRCQPAERKRRLEEARLLDLRDQDRVASQAYCKAHKNNNRNGE